MMRREQTTLLLFVAGVALIGGLSVSGVLTTSKIMPSTGSVKAINVEVYWDSSGSQIVDSIDWGTPVPGDVVQRIVYIENSGNAPMNLSISNSGWNPSNSVTYLSLSWDREGYILAGDEIVKAILTLNVSSGVTGITDFSFNIIIEGVG